MSKFLSKRHGTWHGSHTWFRVGEKHCRFYNRHSLVRVPTSTVLRVLDKAGLLMRWDRQSGIMK